MTCVTSRRLTGNLDVFKENGASVALEECRVKDALGGAVVDEGVALQEGVVIGPVEARRVVTGCRSRAT